MRENLLGRLRAGKALTLRQLILMTVQLSIPAIMAKVTSVIMQYIDASMVGTIGAEAAASIGLVDSSTWLLGGLTLSVGTGFTVQAAHRIGANDNAGARSLMRHGLLTVLLFSAILGAVAVAISGSLPLWIGGTAEIRKDASRYFAIYMAALPLLALNYTAGAMLQASGNMQVPSLLNVMMCILDVIFNLLMIFPSRQLDCYGWIVPLPGAGLGVAGAALGTVMAEACCLVGMLWFLLKRSPVLHLRPENQMFSYWQELREALRLALPMGFEEFVMGGAYVAFTRIVSPLGTVALAANSFAITAESLCYMPGYGVAAAATTLIGQSVGAGRPKLARKLAWVNAAFGMFVMLVMGLFMYGLAPVMMALLSPDLRVIAAGTEVLRIEAFAEPCFAAAIVVTGIFRGAGNTLLPSIVNFISMWGVRIPLAAWLALSYGLRGVWIAMCTELCVRGCLFLFLLWQQSERIYYHRIISKG